MSESRRDQLTKRTNRLFHNLREVRGYLIHPHGTHNEGVFCRDLDAVERELKKMEEELGR